MRVKAARIFFHLGRSGRMLKIHIVCGTLHLVYFLHSGRSCRILKIRMVSGPRLFRCSCILGASVACGKFQLYAGQGASDILTFRPLLSHIKNSYFMSKRAEALRMFFYSGRFCRIRKICMVCGSWRLGYYYIRARYCLKDFRFPTNILQNLRNFRRALCQQKNAPGGGGIKIIKIWPSPGKVNYTPQSLINWKMIKNRCNLLSMSL